MYATDTIKSLQKRIFILFLGATPKQPASHEIQAQTELAAIQAE